MPTPTQSLRKEPQAPSAGGLRATGVIKRFAGVPALKGVDLSIGRGRVVGLVGHNGAGKSTLLKVLAGAHPADEGLISIDGAPLTLSTPSAALEAGISTVYQELSLLENLTVTQNVFLGREVTRLGALERRSMKDRARELMNRFGLQVDVERKLSQYPVATRQLLEIAVAVARDAQFLLLDEPTTSLEGAQVDRFLETVTSLAEDDGLGILLVDHKLDELYAVAHDVVALVDGEVRIDGRADEVDRAAIVVAIAGEDAHASETGVSEPVARRALPQLTADDAPSLRVRDVHSSVLSGVSLEAYPGRVLGVYGLVGAGRTELMRTLVGVDRMSAGSIMLDGSAYRPTTPAAAQELGLVYLTEERKVDGIVGGLDSATNVILPVLDRYRRFGMLDKKRMRRDADQLMDRMRVRGSRTIPVERLSGGNQQKVLLARILAQRPTIILLDEPTKGVDIGVKAEIHRLLRSLAHDDGLTVIVVSSEEDEILELADDVVTLTAGTCDGTTIPVGELSAVELRHAAWNAA